MSENLSRCPHCGGKADFTNRDDNWHQVICGACGCRSNEFPGAANEARPKAAASWNARAAQQDGARGAAVAVFREVIEAFYVQEATQRRLEPDKIGPLTEQNTKAFGQLLDKRLAALEQRSIEVTKLLPCPFCGGDDLRDNKKCVGCACGAQGPYDTEDNISAWNDRAAQREVARTDLDKQVIKFGDYVYYYIPGHPGTGNGGHGYVAGEMDYSDDGSHLLLVDENHIGMAIHSAHCQVVSRGHEEKVATWRERYLAACPGRLKPLPDAHR